MKKINFYIISIISAIAVLLACTKEISIDAISFFDLKVSEESSTILLSTPKKIDFEIISKGAFKNGDYQFRYLAIEGEGMLELNGVALASDAFLDLPGYDNSLTFTANTSGKHQINIEVKGLKGSSKLKELVFQVDQSSYEFSVIPEPSSTFVDGSLNLNMKITSPNKTTFKTKYTIESSGTKPVVIGSVLVNGEVLAQDTFIDTTIGDFVWKFKGASKGTVKLIFTTESASGIVKTQQVTLAVTDVPDFEFSATPKETEKAADRPIEITFNIKEVAGTNSVYTMNFNSALSGVLTYEGKEYPTGPLVPYKIPMKAGESKATYIGKIVGDHNITFTVTNANDPKPISKEAKVKYTITKATFTKLESISVSSPNDLITVGQKETFTVKYSPEDATNKKITWKVSDTTIATIDPDTGVLTALKEGKVTVVATAEERKADGIGTPITSEKEIEVKNKVVEIPATEIIIDHLVNTLGVGKTAPILISIEPENATDKSVTWRSSNTGVATVDSKGNVTGVGVGKVDIFVELNTDKKIFKKISITVTESPKLVASIKFVITRDTKIPLNLGENETESLNLEVLPANATDNSVTWTSSDPAIATVDQTGKISAVGIGYTNITVEANDDSGISKTLRIFVFSYKDLLLKAPKGVKIDLYNSGDGQTGFKRDYLAVNVNTGNRIALLTVPCQDGVGNCKVNNQAEFEFEMPDSDVRLEFSISGGSSGGIFKLFVNGREIF